MAKTNKKTEELHPLVPLPHVRDLLPHEKGKKKENKKTFTRNKSPQHKRTQKK